MAMTLRAEAALKSQRQAALARHPDQTGIDYITAEPGSEPGWDLLVHFIPPAGGVKDKLIITIQYVLLSTQERSTATYVRSV